MQKPGGWGERGAVPKGTKESVTRHSPLRVAALGQLGSPGAGGMGGDPGSPPHTWLAPGTWAEETGWPTSTPDPPSPEKEVQFLTSLLEDSPCPPGPVHSLESRGLISPLSSREPCSICFFVFIYLFIYFWLRWVIVAVRGLSLVAASGGYSLLRCGGFSLSWLLLLQSTGSRCVCFSSCDTRAQ